MTQRNSDIRNEVLKNNLKLWQIGAALGLNDGNFSRLLRKELTKEKKEQIKKIIRELKEEQSNATF